MRDILKVDGPGATSINWKFEPGDRLRSKRAPVKEAVVGRLGLHDRTGPAYQLFLDKHPQSGKFFAKDEVERLFMRVDTEATQ